MIASRRLRRTLTSFLVSCAAVFIPPTLPASAATGLCQASWGVVLQSIPPLHAVDALSLTGTIAVTLVLTSGRLSPAPPENGTELVATVPTVTPRRLPPVQ